MSEIVYRIIFASTEKLVDDDVPSAEAVQEILAEHADAYAGCTITVDDITPDYERRG